MRLRIGSLIASALRLEKVSVMQQEAGSRAGVPLGLFFADPRVRRRGTPHDVHTNLVAAKVSQPDLAGSDAWLPHAS